MGKKCIPGLFCVENMTLFVLVLILILLIYFYYKYFVSYVYNLAFQDARQLIEKTQTRFTIPAPSFVVSSTPDPVNDVFSPPVRTDSFLKPSQGPPPPTSNSRGWFVNMESKPADATYKQMGILTKNGMGGNPLILPLMGRSLRNGRDKWQYYTMTNSAGAAINTKLPVSLNGKSCTGEYGCDNISNGDTVYVEGYNDTFRATIYENGLLSYIPFL